MEITGLGSPLPNTNAAPLTLAAPRVLNLGAPHQFFSTPSFKPYFPANPYGDRKVTTTVDDITIKIDVTRVVGSGYDPKVSNTQDHGSLIIHEKIVTTHDPLNGTTQSTTTFQAGGNDPTQSATIDQLAALVKSKETSADSYSVDITDHRSVSVADYVTDLDGTQHVFLRELPATTTTSEPITGDLSTATTGDIVADPGALANSLALRYGQLDELKSLHIFV